MVENFYGNKANKIVHDLSNEKPKCEIKSIKIYNKRYFMPDTFQQAVLENYTNCPHCIKDSDGLVEKTLIHEGGSYTVDRNMPKVSEMKKEDEEAIKKFAQSKSRGVKGVDIEQNQKDEKVRITASKASRRSGNSKKESKIKKSKAKTKEKRSQKKIATVRKRRQ